MFTSHKTFEVQLKTGEVRYANVSMNSLERYSLWEVIGYILDIDEMYIVKAKRVQ